MVYSCSHVGCHPVALLSFSLSVLFVSSLFVLLVLVVVSFLLWVPYYRRYRSSVFVFLVTVDPAVGCRRR